MITYVQMPDGTVVQVDLGDELAQPPEPGSALDVFLRNEVPPELIPRLEAAEEAPLPRVGVPGAFDVRRGAPPPSRPSRTDVIRERARIAGVELRSAPAEAQLLSALVPDDMTPEHASRIMKRVTGYEHYVRRGSATGEIEVFDPVTEGVFFFDQPGPGAEDFQQFVARDVSAMLGEVPATAVGVGVGSFGGPATTAAGGAVGAAAGAGMARFYQLAQGKQLGLHDLTPLEMAQESGIDALFAAGGSLVPTVAASVARRHWRRFARGLPGGEASFDPAGLDEALQEAIEATQELSRQTGREVRPSVGEVAAAADLPSGTALESAEQPLRQREELGLGRQSRELGEAVEERLGQLEAEVPAPGTRRTDLAENIRSAAIEPEERARRFAEERIGEARRRIQQQVDELSVTVDVPRVGQDLRASIEAVGKVHQREVNRLYEGPGGVYEIADEVLGNRTIFALDALEVAELQANTLGAAWFGKLSPARQATIKKFLGATRGAREAFFVDEAGVARKLAPREVSFRDVQNGLRDLRQIMRDIDDGLLPNVDKRVIAQMTAAVGKARSGLVSLDDTGALQTALNAAEDFTRSTKDSFDRSFAGRLVRKRQDGSYVIDNDDLLDRIVRRNNESNSKAVADVILRPTVHISNPATLEAMIGAREGIKRGLYQRYVDEVVRDGVPKRELHNRFIRDYIGGAKQWLTPSELMRMQRLGGAQDLLEEMERQHRRLIQLAEESPVARNLLPSGRRSGTGPIINALMQDPDAIAEVVRLARGNPEMLDQLKSVAFAQLRNRVTSRTTGQMNLSKLKPYLDAPSGPQGTGPPNADILREVFGDEYVDSLRQVAKLAGLPGARPSTRLGTPKRSAMAELFDKGFRFYTSPLGRGRRGGAFIRTGFALRRERFMARVLRDPELMRDLLRQRRITTRNRDRVIGAILANHGIENVGDILWDLAAPAPEIITPPQSATVGGPR